MSSITESTCTRKTHKLTERTTDGRTEYETELGSDDSLKWPQINRISKQTISNTPYQNFPVFLPPIPDP